MHEMLNLLDDVNISYINVLGSYLVLHLGDI